MIAKKAPVGEDVSEGLEIFAQSGQERGDRRRCPASSIAPEMWVKLRPIPLALWWGMGYNHHKDCSALPREVANAARTIP